MGVNCLWLQQFTPAISFLQYLKAFLKISRVFSLLYPLLNKFLNTKCVAINPPIYLPSYIRLVL